MSDPAEPPHQPAPVAPRRPGAERLHQVAIYFGLADRADEAEPAAVRPPLTGWRAPAAFAPSAVVIVAGALLAGAPGVAAWASALWAITLLVLSPLATPIRDRWPTLDESLFVPAFTISILPLWDEIGWRYVLLVIAASLLPVPLLRSWLDHREERAGTRHLTTGP